MKTMWVAVFFLFGYSLSWADSSMDIIFSRDTNVLHLRFNQRFEQTVTLERVVSFLKNTEILPALSSEVDGADTAPYSAGRYLLHTYVQKWGRHHTRWICQDHPMTASNWSRLCELDRSLEDNHSFFQRAQGRFTQECHTDHNQVICEQWYSVIPNQYLTKSFAEIAGLFVENNIHDSAVLFRLINSGAPADARSAAAAKESFERSASRDLPEAFGNLVEERWNDPSGRSQITADLIHNHPTVRR